MHRQKRIQAFTLAELMVSLTVMTVVIGWVLTAYTSQHQNQIDHERVIEAQHEGRLITDLIIKDLRMAGFMVPTWAGVASVDGGAAASDLICTSDPAVMDTVIVGNRNQRFPGASPAGVVGAGAATVTVPTSHLDVDSDGNDDFVVGSGIIIADDNNAHCASITGIAGGTITFAPVTPAGFAVAPTGSAARRSDSGA